MIYEKMMKAAEEIKEDILTYIDMHDRTTDFIL